jgi:large subunit ribosomal protein L24
MKTSTKPKKFHVRRGDIVEVITGDHKKSTGKILQVITKKQRIIIEGVNLIKKHTRRSQDNPNGGIIEREGSIHISNVKLIERPAFEKSGKNKS